MGRPYGQHFLKDPTVTARIVEACPDLRGGAPLVEIGPGRGALTIPLVDAGAALTAVEIDPRLAEALRARLGARPNFQLIESDFLDVPDGSFGAGPLSFVGNLPYNAAGPIIRRVVRWPGWTSAVVMVQKEVADRLAAEPGGKEFGPLTVETALQAEVEPLFDVPPGAFSPPPKVDSSVVRLWPRPMDLGGATTEGVMRVVHAAFQQRRKKVANSLSSALSLERSYVETTLRDCGIEPGSRAETVPVEAFVRLSVRLSKV
jgi:16S rRNA (adenine1518-N6/adenine1519-N6)-dimethyltransferase